jgi:hypothetical protein
MWQTIESKVRFIEQALAGEITARMVEDTSEVVLSAVEIKAIAQRPPPACGRCRCQMSCSR